MTTDFDILIVGSGFSGLGMAVRLKQAGRHDFAILERGDDVGGTWSSAAGAFSASTIHHSVWPPSAHEPKVIWWRSGLSKPFQAANVAAHSAAW